ncbi:MAG: CBS domain-containing protein [Longimonas sp.]|uniref:CBS domain-containing protein n=1 Tax=Longimonas sp. TaxID=2039626 RepID=UPI0033545376
MDTVEAIMTRDVVSVLPETPLLEVQKLLKQHGFRHLVVVKDGVLKGVLSNRDVLQALSPFLNTNAETQRDVRTLAYPTRKLMNKNPKTITPDTPPEKAAHLLLTEAISALPVVEGKKLVGIITTKDLLRHYTAA